MYRILGIKNKLHKNGKGKKIDVFLPTGNAMHKISTPEEMMGFGENLAKAHKILLVHGELGAGKTLLAKGFAKGLGLDEHKVQSPTYTYLNIYDAKLLHIDMYRIKEYSELVEKGIMDQMNEYEHIVIERPKFIDQLPFKGHIEIEIIKTSETERNITTKEVG